MAELIWKVRLVQWSKAERPFPGAQTHLDLHLGSVPFILCDPRQLLNHFELHFLNSKIGTILLLLRSLWELNKVIYIQFPYLYLIGVNIQYVANDCCYSCSSSHHCGMVLLKGLGMTSVLMLGEFFLFFIHVLKMMCHLLCKKDLQK